MIDNLQQLLENAASNSSHCISVCPAGGPVMPATHLTYRQLLLHAKSNANLLHTIPGITKDSVVLLHFDHHEQSIIWLWAVILAGYLPAMSPPLVNDFDQRKKHLSHLQTLLDNPVILTTGKLVPEFLGLDELNISNVETLQDNSDDEAQTTTIGIQYGSNKHSDDDAILMLTSGSTGHAKAVRLCHGQIIAALLGKVAHHGTTRNDVFLNWIGMDHVAALMQIHLHAMILGAEQIHVQAADLLADPVRFLRLIHDHRVSLTFGPNFFLAALQRTLDGLKPYTMLSTGLDLSCLKALLSGGEANVVQTCVGLTQHLHDLGAEGNVISPGFGMTETCAGSIHAKECPSYDVGLELEFASLGSCIPGISMRIVSEEGKEVPTGVSGSLQLSGAVVFKGYFNNPAATKDAFTTDGWFVTGDKAVIDSKGNLQLTGRAKDTIIINGINYYPHELESAIEDANIAGVTPSYTVVFPHRPTGSATERLVIIYLPTFNRGNAKGLIDTFDAMTKLTARLFGVSPYQIVPLEKRLLPKTSLGKLSRAKIRTAFEAGVYAEFQVEATYIIRGYRQARLKTPETEIQRSISTVFSDMFKITPDEIGTDSSLLDLGVSSIELIAFKTKVQKALNLTQEIPLISVLSNPTIEGIADALEAMSRPKEYNPVVTLHAKGNKTPLWLVHPGVGEVLVFLNLAKYITDRPLHALRARGFEEGEGFFRTLPEIVETYHKHIKAVQPKGPYAIAGYSFGAMICFEITKVLEANGDEVKFLGSFNLPPHIKERMHQLDWVEAGLNLSYFLDLITEEYAHAISPEMHKLTTDEVLDHIMGKAPKSRLEELALDKHKLKTWVSLAHAMQEAAMDYEPKGSVACMDVFHAIPLKLVAKDRDDWVKNKLSKWADFTRTKPRFHKVDGAHYTMMSPDHVFSFQKILQRVMSERGI